MNTVSNRSPQNRRIAFRVDGGPEIGIGHLKRCIALGGALDRLGFEVCFFCSHQSLVSVPELERWPNVCVSGSCKQEAINSIKQTWPDGCHAIIFDHYDWQYEDETAFRSWADHIWVIDDLGDRAHDADGIIDAAPGHDHQFYDGLIPPSCLVLSGGSYALLGRREEREKNEGELVPSILVAMGGGRTVKFVDKILKALSTIGLNCKITAVLDNPTEVEYLAEAFPAEIELKLLPLQDDLSALISSHSIAIGAAGGMAWERCSLGKASIVIPCYDNQKESASILEAYNAAIVMDFFDNVEPMEITDTVRSLLLDPELQSVLSRNGRSLCDGHGAARVAAAIACPVRANDGHQVSLRFATYEDMDVLYHWQESASTRKYFHNPEVPSRDEHQQWFRGMLGRKDAFFEIIMHDNKASGCIRIDKENQSYMVSLVVSPEKRGLGIGTVALDLMRHQVPDHVFRAEIHANNHASKRVFEKAGYLPVDSLSNVYECMPLEGVH